MLPEIALIIGNLNPWFGGKETVNALCDHPDIKAISFVGSTPVGTLVYNRASGTGKRAQCMMAANNHGIVLPDANKEHALNALIGACFGASAQRCMAIHTLPGAGRHGQRLAAGVCGNGKIDFFLLEPSMKGAICDIPQRDSYPWCNPI